MYVVYTNIYNSPPLVEGAVAVAGERFLAMLLKCPVVVKEGKTGMVKARKGGRQGRS